MKRILIDGRFIGVGESMTRYTLEIVKGILALDKENEYTLLIRPAGLKKATAFLAERQTPNAKRDQEDVKRQTLNVKLVVLDIPHYSIGEQFRLLKYLNREKFDLVHFIQFNHPIRYRGDFVVTVHDLTMVGYLHRTNPIKKVAFLRVMKSAVEKSKKIITISKTAKNEIVDYYHTDPAKISVIYNGLDHDNFNPRVKEQSDEIKEFKQKYHIDTEYILYTGMWKKHKNLLRLISAFEQFSERRLKNKDLRVVRLVLVGKINKDEKETILAIDQVNQSLNMKYNISEAILTTGFIEESELPLAYAGAVAYVIPSLSEGFGMPPLEAMACGVPVISSKVSAMPEILGEAPIYFDPMEKDDIAKAMERVVEDKQERIKSIKKGLEQVKKYDWSKTAEETLAVYKEVLQAT